MQPSSLYFAIFLGIVTVLYFSAPIRFRWVILLVASCYFYVSWGPGYLFFIVPSIIINFFISREIGRNSLAAWRRGYLILGIFVNLLPLVFFKYSGFVIGQINNAHLGFNFPNVPPAPVGISFYTLQVIAYMLDIYKGLQLSENHLGKFALFTSFFPLQVSGPIERAKNLLPQFSNPASFDYSNAKLGLKRMAWGVFKKIVIADRLAIYVNQVFDHPTQFKGFPVILAILFFAFQLYCDFSGYTDIVLGAARMLGYELTENFKNPYLVNSVQKFWNSWHISLSTWLRDYIFFPLRRRLLRNEKLPAWLVQYSPPLITMLVCGIWHGSNWTFLIWGFLHGNYLAFENHFRPGLDRFIDNLGSRTLAGVYSVFQTCFTFLLICFGWVFFRANSVSDALILLGNLTKLGISTYTSAIGAHNLNGFFKPFIFDGGLNQGNLILSFVLIVFVLSMESMSTHIDFNKKIDTFPLLLRWGFYVIATFMIILLSVDVSTQNFIYFQF